MILILLSKLAKKVKEVQDFSEKILKGKNHGVGELFTIIKDNTIE